MEKPAKKILLVEDDEQLKKMLAILFREEGYKVEYVNNGQEALDLLQQDSGFGLIASDMFMPIMNGFELMKACRKNYPSIKTILFSGGGRGINAEHGDSVVEFGDEKVEVELFLKKPFDVAEMLSSVKNLLGG